jgi:non-specific serine/threonine protein kinase/serine/threonine-protein kinase
MSEVDNPARQFGSDAETQIHSGRLGSSDPAATLHVSGASSASPLGGAGAQESTTFGQYKLIRRLGEGGMGQVWLAEQTTPVQRQVAIKLIRVGIYDAELLQRFRAERQSLAMMDHPAIAKVFDAGATGDGQPYFVMEFVPGVPITEYCDRKHLTIRQRLELLIKVCEGVQHAHQKAIIHRDLKPANILVAEVDGKPVPRIIDFGLAKAISPEIGGDAGMTRIGGFVGTPGYMSPEQADSSVQDVDTRTDVYALGVLLYVLLTGDEPFDTSQWKTQPLHEVLRQLREVDPPRPSTKMRMETPVALTNAIMRGAQLKQLQQLLHGDLDWITMKALEKDRSRRYGTPMELAADVERYLNNQPIVARPASTTYRLQKYVRRNRLGVAVAAGLILLLAGFAAMQVVQVRRVTRERDRAARERDRANRITDFMLQMFKVSDPSEARGNSITARELLDKSSTDVDTGLTNDPELQAQMLQAMGEVYSGLGLRSRAETLLTRAVDIRRRILGPDHPDTLDSMSRLSEIFYFEGRYPDAEKLQRETLAAQQRVLGSNDARTVRSMSQLAATFDEEGHYTEAERLEREVLETDQKFHSQDWHSLMSDARSLGWTLTLEGHNREADKSMREALALCQRNLGTDHPETLKTAAQLGEILHRERHFDEAEKLLRQTIDQERRVLGTEHQETTESMNVLATTLEEAGRFSEAEPLFRQTLAIQLRTLGPEHRVVLAMTTSLGNTLMGENRFADAEKVFRQVLETQRRVLGPDHPDTLNSTMSLGNALMEQGHYREAEKVYLGAFRGEQRVLGPDHPNTAMTAYDLGCVAAHQGHKAEAISYLTQAVDHGLAPYGDLGMPKDPDLNSLHGDPRFTAVVAHAKEVAQAKQKPAAQKTN